MNKRLDAIEARVHAMMASESEGLMANDVCRVVASIAKTNDDGTHGPDVSGFVLLRESDGLYFNVRKPPA